MVLMELAGLVVEVVLLGLAFGLGAWRGRCLVVVPSPRAEALAGAGLEMAALRRLGEALLREGHQRPGQTVLPWPGRGDRR